MTERMRRNLAHFSGRRMLFFGARNANELPYFGPLLKLPRDFLDIHFAFSRDPEHVAKQRLRRAERKNRRQLSAEAEPHKGRTRIAARVLAPDSDAGELADGAEEEARREHRRV